MEHTPSHASSLEKTNTTQTTTTKILLAPSKKKKFSSHTRKENLSL
jgi:hypothetical protein